MPSDSLARTVVVLTGASSGIGHATALALAREGADLVLASRGRPGLEMVAAECEKLGARTLVVPTDISDIKAVRALASAAAERFGGIDVWINNVGVGAVGRFDITPIEAHRRVIETNLLGHLHGAHAVLPHFRNRACGTLINMVSVGGWAATPYAAAYVASKFAIRGLSEALRAELSDMPHVHVCEVYPTFVDTPGMAHGANYTGKRIKPPPPLVDPRRVADAVLSLVRRPRPVVAVGSVALPARLAHALAPQLVGRTAQRVMQAAFDRADPAPVTDGNLYQPSEDHAIDGGYRTPVTRAATSAGAATLVAGLLGVAFWWVRRAR